MINYTIVSWKVLLVPGLSFSAPILKLSKIIFFKREQTKEIFERIKINQNFVEEINSIE